MEAAERFSCASFAKTFEVQCSCFESGGAADGTVEAVWGSSLYSGERHMVRASSVIFPYLRWAGGDARTRPNTSGLAAGASRQGAIIAALCELIERDAVSRFFEGERPCAVDLSELADPTTRHLLEVFKQHGIELFVADLSSFAYAPTFKAFAIDTTTQQTHLAVTGQACHPDARVALRKTLLEVAQARATAIQASREDFRRHRLAWGARYAELRESFDYVQRLLSQPPRAAMLGSIAPEQPVSLDRLLGSLANRFREVIAVDLTHVELAVPVIRVVVPGLADTFIGHSREDRHVS